MNHKKIFAKILLADVQVTVVVVKERKEAKTTFWSYPKNPNNVYPSDNILSLLCPSFPNVIYYCELLRGIVDLTTSIGSTYPSIIIYVIMLFYDVETMFIRITKGKKFPFFSLFSVLLVATRDELVT